MGGGGGGGVESGDDVGRLGAVCGGLRGRGGKKRAGDDYGLLTYVYLDLGCYIYALAWGCLCVNGGEGSLDSV